MRSCGFVRIGKIAEIDKLIGHPGYKRPSDILAFRDFFLVSSSRRRGPSMGGFSWSRSGSFT
jgi:hypothetical protein